MLYAIFNFQNRVHNDKISDFSSYWWYGIRKPLRVHESRSELEVATSSHACRPFRGQEDP
jgi:hypothetical protein